MNNCVQDIDTELSKIQEVLNDLTEISAACQTLGLDQLANKLDWKITAIGDAAYRLRSKAEQYLDQGYREAVSGVGQTLRTLAEKENS